MTRCKNHRKRTVQIFVKVDGSKVTPMVVSLTDDKVEDVMKWIQKDEDAYFYTFLHLHFTFFFIFLHVLHLFTFFTLFSHFFHFYTYDIFTFFTFFIFFTFKNLYFHACSDVFSTFLFVFCLIFMLCLPLLHLLHLLHMFALFFTHFYFL